MKTEDLGRCEGRFKKIKVWKDFNLRTSYLFRALCQLSYRYFEIKAHDSEVIILDFKFTFLNLEKNQAFWNQLIKGNSVCAEHIYKVILMLMCQPGSGGKATDICFEDKSSNLYKHISLLLLVRFSSFKPSIIGPSTIKISFHW